MSDLSVEDEMTRDIARLGRSAAAVVAAWQARNPGAKKMPRKVATEARMAFKRDQKAALQAFREDMKATEARRLRERELVRGEIERQIRMHRGGSISVRRHPASTPEKWVEQQWRLARDREQIEQTIAGAPHLSEAERGQAVMALTTAHYTDDPKAKIRPVWSKNPSTGISAVKERLAARMSRVKLGMERQLDRYRDRRNKRPELVLQQQPVNAYWTRQQATTPPDLARIEQLQRQLAADHERQHKLISERDQLQAKVDDLGARFLDSQREYRSMAEQVAQRGRELTDMHAELQRVRGERDQLQQQVQPPKSAKSPKAPETPAAPEQPAPAAKSSVGRGRKTSTPSAPAAPSTPEVPTDPGVKSSVKRGARSGSRARKAPAMASTPEREMVGATAGAAVNGAVNGAVRGAAAASKITRRGKGAPTAPEAPQMSNQPSAPAAPSVPDDIPLPPEPPSVPEPPEMDFDR
ncbi:hypothetical protein [Nocardia cyriacigeorgica]|uniref:hypothetical protein n=1 Tax=Nocardia cyriacigeorgica TaxID=135487 RepID=UPI0024560D36|nr:hypothetical protein [Nocardia cyriacigeorgica]